MLGQYNIEVNSQGGAARVDGRSFSWLILGIKAIAVGGDTGAQPERRKVTLSEERRYIFLHLLVGLHHSLIGKMTRIESFEENH